MSYQKEIPPKAWKLLVLKIVHQHKIMDNGAISGCIPAIPKTAAQQQRWKQNQMFATKHLKCQLNWRFNWRFFFCDLMFHEQRRGTSVSSSSHNMSILFNCFNYTYHIWFKGFSQNTSFFPIAWFFLNNFLSVFTKYQIFSYCSIFPELIFKGSHQ